MTKITTKTWLVKVTAIFTYRTSLLHRIIPPASFYSKTKIGCVFSFQSSFGVLISTFDMRVWMTYLFCVIKNDLPFLCYKEQEQCKAYYWRRKIKCCARNHTIIFVCSRGTTQEHLFPSCQSLYSWRKLTQRRINFR